MRCKSASFTVFTLAATLGYSFSASSHLNRLLTAVRYVLAVEGRTLASMSCL